MKKLLAVVKVYYFNSFLTNAYLSTWPSDWHYCIVPANDHELNKNHFLIRDITMANADIVSEDDLYDYISRRKTEFELFLAVSDDSLMAVPKLNDIEQLMSLGNAIATFHFSCGEIKSDEVFSPKKYVTPDNFLAGVILKQDFLFDYIDDVMRSNNRWLGHAVALKAYQKRHKLIAFRDGDNILPCLSQISGVHVKHNRSLIYPILLAYQSEINELGLGNERVLQRISDLVDFVDIDEYEKGIIDEHLSNLTRWAISFSQFSHAKFKNDKINLDGKKVVIFKVECIGDVVTTTPFFDAVLNSNAKEIVLVTTEAMRSIFECDSRYSKIIYLPINRKKARFSKELYNYLEADIRSLKEELSEFEVALFPRYCVDTNLYRFVSVMLGIKERLGLSIDPVALEFNILYDRMMTKNYNPPYELHESERMLWFANQLGLDTENINRLNIGIAANNSSSNYLVVGLGAASQDRRWPKENYVSFINLLSREYSNIEVKLLGGEDVVDDADYISNHTNAINSVGKISLMDSALIVCGSKMYIGHDSGLMHISAAVGVPILEISKHPMTGYLWHANSSKRFGPWGVKYTCVQPVIGLENCVRSCKETQAHCICEITPEQVYKHFVSLFND
ncbi:glycosyltransferase family 9 protein [Aeromonas veronii]|uniref:glycosyltransferase family 9 protein n=2 Tax=Aeromonas veronii TaxID=654 RepID=UPI00191D2072|nr:glycosyltransferase family 9 protein [Aeromonas veronii]MBL0595143.1 glycosyltransferase family 9 protein [Aeromonas veronii]